MARKSIAIAFALAATAALVVEGWATYRSGYDAGMEMRETCARAPSYAKVPNCDAYKNGEWPW